jgi:hypothetical protein
MNYASSLTDSCRRAAVYVDKILKGASPADLPIQQRPSSNWSLTAGLRRHSG